MKAKHKAAAAVLSGMLAVTSAPITALPAGAAEGDILVTDFEDGDVSAFSKRGDTDTSVIGISEEGAYSGTKCMSVTERTKNWNGPSVALEALGCKPGVQYVVSAMVKAQWYCECTLSMQYTDGEGEQHYNNLTKVTSQGEWVEIPETKFSFSEDMLDVQIYIEGNSAEVVLYVDDFALTEAPVHPIEQDIPGLKDVYADYFKIGGAVTASELAPQSTKDLILKHYNSITLGNELKPENMLDKAATLAYYEETGDNTKPVVKLNGAARVILNFCRDNHIPVRGHVLVWHSQTPGWFFMDDYSTPENESQNNWTDKETMTKRMENYIKGVFEAIEAEYSDVDFYAWDVVNEAWLDGGVPREGGTYEQSNGNKSGWTQIWGDNSFIELAFQYARKYAPKGTKLYYNDFNEYMPQKVEAVIKMATDLKEKGLIDGIGLQSHLNVTNNGPDPFPSASTYKSALAKYAALGLDLQVTELDATYNTDVADGEKLQAQYYSDIMDAIVEYKDSISAVVFWGTTDDQSWRADRLPLLFNEDYTAKPCFYSIIDGIEYTAPATTEPKETTAPADDTTVTAGAGKLGDVDCNGDINVADAVMLARFNAEDKEITVSAQGKANADVNADGNTDTDDLTAILEYLAGIRPTL